jgi:recombination protein RecR
MDSINKLIQIFSDFPGIGPRQAKRFVYFLLTRDESYLNNISRLVSELKKDISICKSCFRFFPKTNSQMNICGICADQNRDESVLMLVSRDIDMENIEKSKSFNGKYFILGGTIPILEKTPERKIRLKELMNSVESKAKSGTLKEIIIATNLNPEGENTADFIQRTLRELSEKYNIKISKLGRGLSTGTELEYSDNETIKNALQNRH